MASELNTLKEQISEKTSQFKFPQSKITSRIIYVVLSQSMNEIKILNQKWYPIFDENVSQFHQWVSFSGDEGQLERDLKSCLMNLFNTSVYTSLTEQDYEIVGTANQIIIIGDLTDEEIDSKLKLTIKTLEGVLKNFTTVQTPFYWVGVFQLRSFSTNKDGQLQINPPENLEFLQSYRDRFDRVFVMDVLNENGIVIKKADDFNAMVAQLLFFLRKSPIQFFQNNNSQGFSEWLKSCHFSEGMVSGISAASIILPIDEIVELNAVGKGIEVLKEAFLADHDEALAKSEFELFLSNNDIFSLETLQNKLKNSENFKLIDPFEEITIEDLEDEHKAVFIYESVDASLSRLAAENNKILEHYSREIIQDFGYSLSDQTDNILTKESSCISLAISFMEKLENKLKVLKTKVSTTTPEYTDPAPLIQIVKRKISGGPEKVAVFIRTLILSITIFFGFYNYWIRNLQRLLSFTGLLLLITIATFIYWHAFHTRLERKILKIEKYIHEKWLVLMQRNYEQIMSEIVVETSKIVKEQKSKIQLVSERIEEIIKFFKYKYKIKIENENTVWRYLLKSENDFEQYKDLITVPVSDVAKDYLQQKRPLTLWKRLSPVNASELNNWEMELAEKAFIHLLPYTDRILQLSICKILSEQEDRMNTMANLLVRLSQPFVTLVPEAKNPEQRIVLQIGQKDCDKISTRFEQELSHHYKHVEMQSLQSHYKLSFLSLSDNIDLKDIRLSES